jgi:CheY-like chemotaxis protein
MSKILVVDDEPMVCEVIQAALADEGHIVRSAPNGQRGLEMLAEEMVDLVITDLTMPVMDGLEFLERLRRDQSHLKCLMMTGDATPEAAITALRERVCGLLAKPFTIEELRATVNRALAGCPAAAIEAVSARPDWVELRVPCDLAAVHPLQKLLAQLEADLPAETCEAIDYAFREMLNNAIEHGCKLDPIERVEVSFVRLKRAVICRIKDPGEGFDPARLEHAAINNPSDDPLRHISVRSEQGLRAGGFGILLTKQLVDELVYNEQHNEMLFVKYLP